MTTLHETVGGLVAERPGWARVFEEFGIDYCCGGRRTLGEACEGAAGSALTRSCAGWRRPTPTAPIRSRTGRPPRSPPFATTSCTPTTPSCGGSYRGSAGS